MTSRSYRREGRTIPAFVVGGAAYWVLTDTGPVMRGPEIVAIPAVAAGVLALCGFILMADLFWFVGASLDWIKARMPRGHKGSAGWAKSLRELGDDVKHKGWGPYWGTFKGKEIIAPYESNALTVGTAGSGKGISVLQTNALSITGDKIIMDLKGENACVLAQALRDRGEEVRILNLGNMWPDILGESDSYNPCDIIADNFHSPGGLLDVSDDVLEMCFQLLEEPPGGKHLNSYFEHGGRTFLGFTKITNTLINGYEASMGDLAQMLNDRDSLYRHALLAAGRLPQKGVGAAFAKMPIENSPWVHLHDPEDVANFIEFHRGLASGVAALLEAEDSKTAESFLTEAQQSVARFNLTTRTHKITKRSTFRFADHKEGKVKTTFIIVDATRLKAQQKAASLFLWAMSLELKRHPNKARSVTVLADEANNFKLSNLASNLTWDRSYGLRWHIFIHSFPAFDTAYDVKNPQHLALGNSDKAVLARHARTRNAQNYRRPSRSAVHHRARTQR